MMMCAVDDDRRRGFGCISYYEDIFQIMKALFNQVASLV